MLSASNRGADGLREEPPDRRLAGARRAPEQHRREAAGLDEPAQRRPGTQQVGLADDLVEGARAHPRGEGRQLGRGREERVGGPAGRASRGHPAMVRGAVGADGGPDDEPPRDLRLEVDQPLPARAARNEDGERPPVERRDPADAEALARRRRGAASESRGRCSAAAARSSAARLEVRVRRRDDPQRARSRSTPSRARVARSPSSRWSR